MDPAAVEREAPATVGRFAPSPSGRMHVGNAFASLMAWLAARSVGGRMVLRIEDLDERCRNRAVAETLIDDLAWMGLDWDEGPYRQSERGDVYDDAFEQLEKAGLTYPCFCSRASLHAASAPHGSDGTPVYRGSCRALSASEIERRRVLRAPATRLAVDGAEIDFNDAVFGRQHEVLARDCGDFVLRRGDGVYAYQLACAVDDALMGVTQVVRGNDLLGSTGRQIYVQQLLGLANPGYGHVPLLVAADGRRLAKRDGDLDVGTLRARGVSPERLVGWLGALAGFADTGAELSAAELVARFSWDSLKACGNNIVVDAGAVSAV
ncbi:tRNA glutamyl-Q(34) synthetase GluQRS [Coriobacteriales bacterium OH1046]|nr:tRNA glutamyl-Q(34) synthetase GluQRS [Coriobacteriales bacterium OH1046]